MSNRITLTLSIRNIRTRFWSISNISFLWAFAKCYSISLSRAVNHGAPNKNDPEWKVKSRVLAAKRLCPWLGFIVTSMITPASTILNICLCHQEKLKMRVLLPCWPCYALRDASKSSKSKSQSFYIQRRQEEIGQVGQVSGGNVG